MTGGAKRAAMKTARKRRIWLAHGGRCVCDAPVPMTGPGVTYDHRIPLWMHEDAEDDANVRPLCDACNKAKTALDATVRGKVKRLQENAVGAPKKPSSIRSPGFRKDVRKRMDGRVERRDPKT